VKDPDVGSKEFDTLDEYKGQDDGTAAWAAGEATQGLEFGHGDGEHASVTPLRQKRFFKDLSPPKMSPPDSSDGPISPLQGGSEDRYLPTLPSVFGRGGKELAARDLDVEAGVSEEGGRIPDIEVAHAGQGDGDGATVLSEGTAAPGGEAKEADEETRDQQRRGLPYDGQSMTKTQRRHWLKTQAKRREREKGKGETSEMLALATIPLE
jgi:hypothetical protein